jgi:hypothetical protein
MVPRAMAELRPKHKERTMIKPGKYKARARSWEPRISKKGNKYLEVTFVIDDATSIVWRGTFTDKTLETVLASLRVCGWNGHDFMYFEGLDTNEVELVIQDETDDRGRTGPRVRWINALGTRSAGELDEAAMDDFAAELQIMVEATKKPSEGRERG